MTYSSLTTYRGGDLYKGFDCRTPCGACELKFDYVSDYLLHLLYCNADNKSSRFSAIQILFIYILHWYHTFL
nr:MAG TPA: hypothetical protein [Caudoviricetes sp.]